MIISFDFMFPRIEIIVYTHAHTQRKINNKLYEIHVSRVDQRV